MSGKTLTENEWVKLGARHTLTLEPHRPFQLHKGAWDQLDLDRIRVKNLSISWHFRAALL